MPWAGSDAASSARESVAEKRCSWLASRNWVCLSGGRVCVLVRNWDAMEVALGVEETLL